MFDGEDNFSSGSEDGSGADEKGEKESYKDYVTRTKKYADDEAAFKAIYDGDRAIKVREKENGSMRQFINNINPLLPLLEEYMGTEAYKKKYGNAQTVEDIARIINSPASPIKPDNSLNGGEAPKDKKGANISEEDVVNIVSNILGSQLTPLKQKLSSMDIRETLKAMRGDKENFPYMSKEVEEIMGKVLKLANNSFPVDDPKALKVLYQAAIGERLPKILEDYKTTVTDQNYKDFMAKKGSFFESNRQGNAGTVDSSESEQIRQRIKNAGGKRLNF
jgi:hypothetical protein